MEKRRVVITGLGVISAIGNDAREFWESIRECRSGIAPIETIDRTLLRCQNGAEVKNYNAEKYFDKKQIELVERFAQFGLIAAREAVADAGIELTDEMRERTCIVSAASIGGQDAHDKMFADLYKEGKKRLHPLTIPRLMPNSGASNISMEFDITGPTFTISTACASGNHAVGNAFWMIRNGISDFAIAGGSETPISFGYIKGWEGLRVMSPDTCRPFSRDRRGMILGEGGAMLFLETLESAQKRGAKIYAEIVGFGMSADASHITTPEKQGAERAMKLALSDGEVLHEKIDYINAHGTGTQINDRMETAAIRNVFGSHAGKLAVSSTKSLHGHALSATGAIEAVATALAIKNKVLPPTGNFTEADPDCDLDYVPNEAREKKIIYAMSNAFAFGGLNAVLVFRRFD